MNKIEVCVVGLGYIGLPTALILAANGTKVIGVDKNIEVVTKLKNDEITFDEDGLSQLLVQAKEKGIRFVSECQAAEMYIIAVPTPYVRESKKIDATLLVAAVESVLRVCQDNAIIIIESTVSPGTIEKYIKPLIGKKRVNIAHAPERIIPGRMMVELKCNNRIIGADDDDVAEKVRELYSTFCDGEIIKTSIRNAEMSKVVENTYRDINIAFANELTKICNEAGLDVHEIIKIANMHPRVNILSPGPGVGGHCISVDPWFLVGDYPGLANLILTARRINDSMPEYVLSKARELMELGNIDDYSRVGVYGITYKENVDDIRESPTIQLLESQKNHMAPCLKCYDPMLRKKIIPSQVMDFDEFLREIDIVILMVAHKHIIDNQERIRGKVILDTRNCLSGIPTFHL